MNAPTIHISLLSQKAAEGQASAADSPLEAPQEQPQSSLFDTMLIPMLGCGLVLWLIVLRPEKKQRKLREQMLSALMKGDEVVTSGGIHGSVVSVKDEVVTILVADGVRLRFSINAIQTLPKKEEPEAKAS